MNKITTLVLAVLAVLAWIWIQFLGEEPKARTARPPLVPEEILADLQEIECKLFSGERILLMREPGGHFLMKFGSSRAGQRWIHSDEVRDELVEQLVQSILDSWRTLYLKGEATADDFLRANLDPPKYELMVRSSTEECAIHFGADVAGTHDVYAREVGEQRLFQTGRQIPNLLDLNAQDWRERKIFDFVTDTVTGFEIFRTEPNEEPKLLQGERQGNREWEIIAPKSVKADANKVRALIHQTIRLEIDSFLSEDLKYEKVTNLTGIPNQTRGYIMLQSGEFQTTVEVGKSYQADLTAVRILERDEQMIVAVETELLESIFDSSLDDLRARRLTPSVERSMVEMQVTDAEGEVLWHAARVGKHPRGRWEATVPFERPLHAGSNPRSFPQVVADFDLMEVEEFLGTEREFAPERVLTVRWRAGEIVRDLSIELMQEGEAVLARLSDRGEEIVRVPPALYDIAELPIELYQDRVMLPPQEKLLPKITGYSFVRRDGHRIELEKEPGRSAPRRVRDPEEQSSHLTSAVSVLCGYEAVDLLPAAEVENSGLNDPQCTVTIETTEETYTLKIGATGPDGVYCSVTPKFEGLVLVSTRTRLEGLLEL